MNQNLIIKALQEELAKKCVKIANKQAPINQDDYISRVSGEIARTYIKIGHEASNAFWLPLIEKAVEGLEYFRKLESSDNVSYDANIGKKAREFLNTLADASGEMNKESNSGK